MLLDTIDVDRLVKVCPNSIQLNGSLYLYGQFRLSASNSDLILTAIDASVIIITQI